MDTLTKIQYFALALSVLSALLSLLAIIMLLFDLSFAPKVLEDGSFIIKILGCLPWRICF